MKVLIKNQQRLIKIDQQKVKSSLEKALRFLGLEDSEVSVLFVNDGRIKTLNAKYRGMNKATDVLSFPQDDMILLGDIVINLQAAKRQAIEYGHSLKEELNRLLIHGLLHLLGYDHEKSKYADKKMREKEEKLLMYLMKG